MYLQVNKKLQPRKSARNRLAKITKNTGWKSKKVWLFAGVTILGAATIIGLVAGLSMNATAIDSNVNSGNGQVTPDGQNGSTNPQNPGGVETNPNNGTQPMVPPPANPDGQDNNLAPEGEHNGGQTITPQPDGDHNAPNAPEQPAPEASLPPMSGMPNVPEQEQPESQPSIPEVPSAPEANQPQTPPETKPNEPEAGLPPAQPETQPDKPSIPPEQPKPQPDNEVTVPPKPQTPVFLASYYNSTGWSRPDELLVPIPLNSTIYRHYQSSSRLQEYVDGVIRHAVKLDELLNLANTGKVHYGGWLRFGDMYAGVNITYKGLHYLGSSITLQLVPKPGFAWSNDPKDIAPKFTNVKVNMVVVDDQVDVPGFSASAIINMNKPKPPVNRPPVNQLKAKRHLHDRGLKPEFLDLTWNWEYVQQFRFFLQLYNGPQGRFLGNRNQAFEGFLKQTLGVEQLIRSFNGNHNRNGKGNLRFRDQYENVEFAFLNNSADLNSYTFWITVKPIGNAQWAEAKYGNGNEAVKIPVRVKGLGV